MSPAVRLSTAGFVLIAVCYGLARFSYGLFLPDIRADLTLSPQLVGLVAGGSFLGYCVAIVAAAVLTERLGPRPVALAAGIVATSGLVLIAVANSGVMLAAAVLFAGMSTGLASPPLAAAVTTAVRSSNQNLTNTFINAGTSIGVALAGPAAIALGANWRFAYGIFAAVALVATVGTWFAMKEIHDGRESRSPGWPAMTPNVVRLIIASVAMGVASTAVWSFGGELLARNLGWTSVRIGGLWMLLGVAGLIGSVAGSACDRFGLNAVHRVSTGCFAASIVLIGSTLVPPTLVMIGAAVFGAAYIMLTGVYLVWGIAALPDRPATGLMIAFLAIAAGQTVGAPLFGLVLGSAGADTAVVTFGTISLAAATWRRTPKTVSLHPTET